MSEQKLEAIRLENLLLDTLNPRYAHDEHQRDILRAIIEDQGVKLVNLAENIATEGLNPSDLPFVMKVDGAEDYIVLEGNRRIAALKLALSSMLLESMKLPKKYENRFKALAGKSTLPQTILCAVFSSREEAKPWILLKHTGENAGVGVVQWTGVQRERFRGTSAELQAIDLVGNSNYIDEETRQKLARIPYTNLQRIFDTPDAIEILGIKIENDDLILPSNSEEALVRLAQIITDVTKGDIKVTQIDTKPQILSYVREVVSRPLPELQVSGNGNSGSSRSSVGEPTKIKSVRKKRVGRKWLIPKNFSIAIPQTRINQIYHELQQLAVEEYPNCCAVTLRTFIELSVDEYAKKNGIEITRERKLSGGSNAQLPEGKELGAKHLPLEEKIKKVVKHLEASGCPANELQGIKALSASTDSMLSVNSLHAYVHNPNFNPAPVTLLTTWDSIQEFMKHLWS